MKSSEPTLVQQHFLKMITKNEKAKLTDRRASLIKLSNECLSQDRIESGGFDHPHERRNT